MPSYAKLQAKIIPFSPKFPFITATVKNSWYQLCHQLQPYLIGTVTTPTGIPEALHPLSLKSYINYWQSKDGDQQHPAFLKARWGPAGTFYLTLQEQQSWQTPFGGLKFTGFLHGFSSFFQAVLRLFKLVLFMYWTHDLESTCPGLEDSTECCRKHGAQTLGWSGNQTQLGHKPSHLRDSGLSSKMKLPDQKQFVGLRPTSLMEDLPATVFQNWNPPHTMVQEKPEQTLHLKSLLTTLVDVKAAA